MLTVSDTQFMIMKRNMAVCMQAGVGLEQRVLHLAGTRKSTARYTE